MRKTCSTCGSSRDGDDLRCPYCHQLAESRARVEELEEALGNILLSHDGRCVLVCDDQNPFGKWDCVEECTDRIVRKARSRSEAKEKQ